MELSYRQLRQLRLIDAAVRRSDPHLDAMFGIFDRLYIGQDLPGVEQLGDPPAGRGTLLRAAASIMAALTNAAVAISDLFGKAITTATTVGMTSGGGRETGLAARGGLRILGLDGGEQVDALICGVRDEQPADDPGQGIAI
jgi:hypothetical protein